MDPKRRRGDKDPESHIGFLDEVEGAARKKRRPGKEGEGPLDVDDVW